MSKYSLVPEARSDLLNILEYIAEDNFDAALRVHERFEEVFELLADNPEIGHREVNELIMAFAGELRRGSIRSSNRSA